jgi:hypothetical protein
MAGGSKKTFAPTIVNGTDPQNGGVMFNDPLVLMDIIYQSKHSNNIPYYCSVPVEPSNLLPVGIRTTNT